jgi:hypothetical protein
MRMRICVVALACAVAYASSASASVGTPRLSVSPPPFNSKITRFFLANASVMQSYIHAVKPMPCCHATMSYTRLSCTPLGCLDSGQRPPPVQLGEAWRPPLPQLGMPPAIRSMCPYCRDRETYHSSGPSLWVMMLLHMFNNSMPLHFLDLVSTHLPLCLPFIITLLRAKHPPGRPPVSPSCNPFSPVHDDGK